MTVSLVNAFFISFQVFCAVWLIAAATFSLKSLIMTLDSDHDLATKVGYSILFSVAFCVCVTLIIIIYAWVKLLLPTV